MILQGKQDVPFINWDIEKSQFRVTIRGVRFEKVEDTKETVITSKPECAYRARIRRVDSNVWTPGFVSPLPVFGVTMIDSRETYILEMRRVDHEGVELPNESSKLFRIHDGEIEEVT